MDLPSPSGDFEGLEELEVDLEAESSRILSPEDMAKVQRRRGCGQGGRDQRPGARTHRQRPGHGDFRHQPGRRRGQSAAGLTGLSALELDDDEDQVLGEGSDVTLSGESSGINIISPSDSGLALDEVALDLTGSSPIGSSLDLGADVERCAVLSR